MRSKINFTSLLSTEHAFIIIARQQQFETIKMHRVDFVNTMKLSPEIFRSRNFTHRQISLEQKNKLKKCLMLTE